MFKKEKLAKALKFQTQRKRVNKSALQWFVEYDFYLKDLKENKRFMDIGPTMAK